MPLSLCSQLAMRIFYIALFSLSFIGCTEQDMTADNIESPVITELSHDQLFEFYIMPPIGSDESTIKGNTATLLTYIPYLYASGVFPSENVLNEVLSKGISDAGMSGGARWTPYNIKKEEFETIFEEVKSISTLTNLEYIEPAHWVKSFDDWNIWVMHIKHNIPWEEHKKLNDIVIEIEKELEVAKANNNHKRINQLHLKYIEESEKLSDYVMRYTKK